MELLSATVGENIIMFIRNENIITKTKEYLIGKIILPWNQKMAYLIELHFAKEVQIYAVGYPLI